MARFQHAATDTKECLVVAKWPHGRKLLLGVLMITACAGPDAGVKWPEKPIGGGKPLMASADEVARVPGNDGGGEQTPHCIVLECNWGGQCWCPTKLPDGRSQPLTDDQCKEANQKYPQLPPDLATSIGGERGKAAKPSGTNSEFKKMKPHPDKPDKVIYKDPHTGKSIEKPKPPGFDEWWNSK